MNACGLMSRFHSSNSAACVLSSMHCFLHPRILPKSVFPSIRPEASGTSQRFPQTRQPEVQYSLMNPF